MDGTINPGTEIYAPVTCSVCKPELLIFVSDEVILDLFLNHLSIYFIWHQEDENLWKRIIFDIFTYCSWDVFLGQQTPGTKRLLKQIDCLRCPKLSSSCGQLLRSSQFPCRPLGVLQGLEDPSLCSGTTTLPEVSVTNGGRAPFTIGAIVSVILRPNTFLLIV